VPYFVRNICGTYLLRCVILDLTTTKLLIWNVNYGSQVFNFSLILVSLVYNSDRLVLIIPSGTKQ
jgi:hypothetical protein